jgi:hypothetical protein
MSDTPPQRTAPRIIWVPLDDRHEKPRWSVAVVPAVGVALLLYINPLALLAALPGVVCVGCWAVFRARRAARNRRRLQERMVQEHPESVDDPFSVALFDLRRGTVWDSEVAQATRKAIVAAGGGEPANAVIVCMTPLDFARTDKIGSEPQIITPTELLWKLFRTLVLMLVGAAACMACPRVVFWLNGVPLLIVSGIFAMVLAWRRWFDPTYVRYAPGIVQVVRFHPGVAKPKINSYPMEAGTFVLVLPDDDDFSVAKLVLLRGSQDDTVSIWHARDREKLMRSIMPAMMSTDPIQKLDDEQLIG